MQINLYSLRLIEILHYLCNQLPALSSAEQPLGFSLETNNYSVSAIFGDVPEPSKFNMTLCSNKYQRLRDSVGWAYLHEWGFARTLGHR